MTDDVETLLARAADDGPPPTGDGFDELWRRGRGRRRRTRVAAAAIGVLAVVGTVAGVVAALDTPPTPQVVGVPSASESAPRPTADPSASPSSSPSASATADDTAVRDDLTYFQSPSGNIACWFGEPTGAAGSVLCMIQEFSYDPVFASPYEDECSFDFGNILTANPEGPGFACYSDAFFIGVDGRDTWDPSRWPIADYGTTVVRDDVRCTSERTGMTCTTAAGDGFTVARADYEFFGPRAPVHDVEPAASGTPAASPSDEDTTRAEDPATDEPQVDDARRDVAFFATAEGNIHCRYLDWFGGYVECLMTEVGADAVAGAADSTTRSSCADDQLQSFGISDGTPEYSCVGLRRYTEGVDAPADPDDWPVVDDGTSVVRSGIRCDVRHASVTCTGRGGHSFTLTPTTVTQRGPNGAPVQEP